MSESEERTVKGLIKAYAKDIKEHDVMGVTLYTRGILIDEEWHNLQAEKKEQLEAFKDEAAPVNSEVEFKEYRKEGSKYWNYKVGTMTILKKGDGVPQGRGGRSFKPSYGQSKEYLLLKDARIRRQWSVNAAIEYHKAQEKQEPLKGIIQTAEAFKAWVNAAGKDHTQDSIEEEQVGGDE